MRRVLVVLLAVLFATVGVAGQEKAPAQKGAKKAAEVKESRWQGHIVRSSKEDSTLTVRSNRPGGHEKIVVYNSSTKWTKLGKPADPSEFKEGSFVICAGKYDEKGRLIASRIDLRLPR